MTTLTYHLTPHIPHFNLLARLQALVALWRERARQRDEFARMDERDLRDIGVSRADLAYQLSKPFWRA